MRFEDALMHRVTGFPQPWVSEREGAVHPVSQRQIKAGVSRGRELHAAFCRRAAKVALVDLPAAGLRFLVRLAASLARAYRKERVRRATSATLSALDDRMLCDIGVDRGDIPYIARSMAYREQAVQCAVIRTLEPKFPAHILLPGRAA